MKELFVKSYQKDHFNYIIMSLLRHHLKLYFQLFSWYKPGMNYRFEVKLNFFQKNYFIYSFSFYSYQMLICFKVMKLQLSKSSFINSFDCFLHFSSFLEYLWLNFLMIIRFALLLYLFEQFKLCLMNSFVLNSQFYIFFCLQYFIKFEVSLSNYNFW